MIVSLPPKLRGIRALTCNADMQRQQTDRQADRPDNENQTRETPTRTPPRKKKNKAGRGGNLDVGAVHGVRIEEEDRGQDEETQGETQTRNGFGFPQHLREKERQR